MQRLNKKLQIWESIVKEVVKGYPHYASEYANDLYTRSALEKAELSLQEKELLEKLDEVFRQNSLRFNTPYFDDEEGWWWYYMPKKIGIDMYNELQNLKKKYPLNKFILVGNK